MQVVYRSLPSRPFGVEFEVSNNLTKRQIGQLMAEYESFTTGRKVIVTPGTKGWAETNANNYWHVKYDSTCGPLGKGQDNGWEIASFIGVGLKDLLHISHVAVFLSDIGAEVNQNCGFHIHVDVGDFSPEAMGSLIARWLKVESLLMAICDPSRRNNKYCRPLRSRWAFRAWRGYDPACLADFCCNMIPGNLSTHDNDDKKVTLNVIGWTIGQLLPFYPRKTVELRLPEARLSFAHVSNWISMFVNFVESCKNSRPPTDLDHADCLKDALEFLGLHGNKSFFLFERDLLTTKLWLLKKIAESESGLAGEASDLVEFLTEI